MERGALYARRPGWAANAGEAFFGEQSVAGAQRAYGAVGGADYVVEGDWNGGAVIPGREDTRCAVSKLNFAMLQLVHSFPSKAWPKELPSGIPKNHFPSSLAQSNDSA